MIVDYDLVYNVYLKLRGNIRNKKSIFYFELLLNSNINYIVNKISNNIFDKIYNHLVSDLILSKLDKYLIDIYVKLRIIKSFIY